MKVAVFSDVHGNLIALERFLSVTKNVVDSYVCLGDIVNYGPWNDECLMLIHALPNVTILEGNHERLFLGTESIEQANPLIKNFFRSSFEGFSRHDLITDLPKSCELSIYQCQHSIGGRSIYADTPIEINRNYIIGHTHHTFSINRSGYKIISPGSVGQNRKWIDIIDYMVFDTGNGQTSFHSINYDFSGFLRELTVRHYPPVCLEYLTSKNRKS